MLVGQGSNDRRDDELQSATKGCMFGPVGRNTTSESTHEKTEPINPPGIIVGTKLQRSNPTLLTKQNNVPSLRVLRRSKEQSSYGGHERERPRKESTRVGRFSLDGV
jgi:hypothetical protein